jgi:predicted small lipoprotein YifL
MKLLTLLLLCLGTLAACDDPGPLEQAGEEVDEAVEDVRNDGETLGNRLDDAVDDVREGVEDAADEVNDNNN